MHLRKRIRGKQMIINRKICRSILLLIMEQQYKEIELSSLQAMTEIGKEDVIGRKKRKLKQEIKDKEISNLIHLDMMATECKSQYQWISHLQIQIIHPHIMHHQFLHNPKIIISQILMSKKGKKQVIQVPIENQVKQCLCYHRMRLKEKESSMQKLNRDRRDYNLSHRNHLIQVSSANSLPSDVNYFDLN